MLTYVSGMAQKIPRVTWGFRGLWPKKTHGGRAFARPQGRSK